MGKGLFRIVHWGPILALTIIGFISNFALFALLQWWPPLSGAAAFVHFLTFCTWISGTLYNFFNAMYNGPGLVPENWAPDENSARKKLQYCQLCEGYKAPRSHHCRKCDRCVMKMDHHCPWINNCVGHKNQGSFIYFLLMAPCGCIQAIWILGPSMYRALNRSYYTMYGEEAGGPLVTMSIEVFICSMFAVGLSIGVIIAVGGLGFMQMRSVLKNETGIESWIREKAEWRDLEPGEDVFVYPYHLGRIQNLKLVFKPKPEYNGIYWPVREGCDQYTLTVEQLKQKKDKLDKSVVFVARKHFSGAMCPVTWSPRVSCCPPCTDEPRIPLIPGDRVLVSRWKKHWLYGDKILSIEEKQALNVKRVRGWFPRKAAAEEPHVTEHDAGDAQSQSAELRKRNAPDPNAKDS